jgi:hypothetical protein
VLHRLTAALVLSALAFVVLPALGLAASSDTDGLEVCQSCEGCEDGRCDESSPFDSGDHCCLSSCLAHSVWAFSAPHSAAPSERCESAFRPDSQTPPQAVPRGLYRPPRS